MLPSYVASGSLQQYWNSTAGLSWAATPR